jgi:hypothetical protein
MKTVSTGLIVALVASGAAIAQVPTKPSGTMRVEADHREFISQVRTTEWRAPAAGVEGFTTYFPDGVYVTTMKLKDGALVHNLGSYRIAGDSWCQKPRIPASSKEACVSNYRTGENKFETWNADGTFAADWNFRVKK